MGSGGGRDVGSRPMTDMSRGGRSVAPTGGAGAGTGTFTAAAPSGVSRAAEAIQMKDEQLRVLQQQNSHLLKSLDKLEEEANKCGARAGGGG